jgi:hypothetical protein
MKAPAERQNPPSLIFSGNHEFKRRLMQSGLLSADMGSLLRYRATHEQNERHQQNRDCS